MIISCKVKWDVSLTCWFYILYRYIKPYILCTCVGQKKGVIKPSYIASSKPVRAIQREYFSKENKTSRTIMNLPWTCLSFIAFIHYMQGQRFSQSLALQIRNKWNHKSSDLCNCCFLLVLVMRKSSMLQFPFPLLKVQKWCWASQVCGTFVDNCVFMQLIHLSIHMAFAVKSNF